MTAFANDRFFAHNSAQDGKSLPFKITLVAAALRGIRFGLSGTLRLGLGYLAMDLLCTSLQASALYLVGSGAAPLRESTPTARRHNVRVGLAGYLEAHLLQRADAARAAGKSLTEALWLGVAVGLRLALLIPRVAALSLTAAQFFCKCAEAPFYHAANAAIFYGMWAINRLAGEPTHIVPVSQLATPLQTHPGPGRREAATMLAYRVKVNETGRTPRNIESLGRLFARYPSANVDQALMEVRAFILQHEGREQDSPLAGMHRCGTMTNLAAAKAALQGQMGPYEPIISAHLRLPSVPFVPYPSSESVPLVNLLATVWQAIALLEAPNGDTQASLQLRDERREALLLAMADCIKEDGRGVCSEGQTQRLLLVLQGFVDCVQVDAVN